MDINILKKKRLFEKCFKYKVKSLLQLQNENEKKNGIKKTF